MNMYDRHNITKFLKLIFSACFILVLSACSSNDDTVATAETVTEIPQFIQKLALNTTDPNASLLAWITIEGGTRAPMTIDSAAGTVSTTITLPPALYNVLIEFEFTDGADTITLATLPFTADLTNGDVSLTFADTDYDTASYDNDSDGIDNVTEIINGTDPLVADISDCILETSVIGGCTLG